MASLPDPAGPVTGAGRNPRWANLRMGKAGDVLADVEIGMKFSGNASYGLGFLSQGQQTRDCWLGELQAEASRPIW